jgi:hypothetical protein
MAVACDRGLQELYGVGFGRVHGAVRSLTVCDCQFWSGTRAGLGEITATRPYGF